MALSFEQTLLVGILSGALGGAVSGIIVVYLKIFLQTKQSKLQKQQYLYGKLLGLKTLICDFILYNVAARINLDFYNYWRRLSDGEAYQESSRELTTCQQTIKETEIGRSNQFSELFETLGLVWAIFPKDAGLDSRVKSCFDMRPISINQPPKIDNKADIKKWRDDEETRIRGEINKQINKPLDLLISYIHDKIVVRR